mmetsp:Transcript_21828/g.62189  ORF Transcript_21828/g.62189 Transcript_21828/m.62189 type:complete len:651 (-) Transcript_21828:183-2135(-)
MIMGSLRVVTPGVQMVYRSSSSSDRPPLQDSSNRRLTDGRDGNTSAPMAIPVSAELAVTEADIENRVTQQLRREFEEQMEAQVRERIVQNHAIAEAVAIPEGGLMTSKVGDDGNNEATLSSSSQVVSPSSQNSKSRLIIAILVILLVGGIIVGIIFAISYDDSSSSSSSDMDTSGAGNTNQTVMTPSPTEVAIVQASTPSPTSHPTSPPTSQPTVASSEPPTTELDVAFQSNLDILWPFLEGEPTFTNISAFDDVTTPQFKAMTWLSSSQLNNNSMEVDVELSSHNRNSDLDPFVNQLIHEYVAAVLYYATKGPDRWEIKADFASLDVPMHNWHNGAELGIRCNEFGEIMRIELEDNKLEGTIPDEIYLLTTLRHMFLGDNQGLEGTISSYIGKMFSLVDLNVAETSVGGTIPTEVGMLSDLYHLVVFDSNVCGTLPTELGNATSLVKLELEYTKMNGTIPSELGRLVDLTLITAFFTEELAGTIPSELANLDQLNFVSMEGTGIFGNVDPIFCERSDAVLAQSNLWMDCGGSVGFPRPPPVVCSCCTDCCDSGKGCIKLIHKPDNCFNGECVHCGNQRYVESCEMCPDLNISSVGSSPLVTEVDENATATGTNTSNEERCRASCMWNATLDACVDRTVFFPAPPSSSSP